MELTIPSIENAVTVEQSRCPGPERRSSCSCHITSQSLCFVISKMGLEKAHTRLVPNTGLCSQQMFRASCLLPHLSSLAGLTSVSTVLGVQILGSQDLREG